METEFPSCVNGHMFRLMPHTVSLCALGALAANDNLVARLAGTIFWGVQLHCPLFASVLPLEVESYLLETGHIASALIAAWLVAEAVAKDRY
jgi:hypothetical protein